MVAKSKSMAESFRDLRSDYAAATESRFRRRRPGVHPTGGSEDYHLRDESRYFKMMEYSRDMDRNDAVVGQMIDRAVDNMIQDGFSLDTDTGDEALDQDLWQRWNDWATSADNCDQAGEYCWHEFERLVPRQALVDGDMLVLPIRDDGTIQLVEAHRVRTPRNTRQNVVLGVLLDDHRKRLQYWITNEDVSPLKTIAKVGDVSQYAVRDASGQRQVFHVYNPKRVSQTRGVTALAPVFDLCGMFEDINFAKVVQQQVVSCFAIFREMESGSLAVGAQQTGSRETENLSDGSVRTIEGIGPGMMLQGRPGEKLQGFSPSVPNSEFFDHVKLMLTLIGVNLGLPLNLVLLDASNTNFSGWRGAIDQARLGFRRNQCWLANRLHKPVYEFKVRQWLAEDSALRNASKKSDIRIFGHKWNLPTWRYIEPEKDARAGAYRVRNVLTSPRRFHAEESRDLDEIRKETIADNAASIRAAKKEAMAINKEFDDDQPCHWRDVFPMMTAEGIQSSTEAKPEPEPMGVGDAT